MIVHAVTTVKEVIGAVYTAVITTKNPQAKPVVQGIGAQSLPRSPRNPKRKRRTSTAENNVNPTNHT